MAIRSLAKKSLYQAGVLPAYHSRRNQHCVTVVMFHRVLPVDDPAWADAEPAWTMPAAMFRECLRFFSRHYTVIGMTDLLGACAGEKELPDRALLITFDDGWADNAETALPLLQEAGLPASIFVVTEALGEPEFWQETLTRGWNQKRLRGSDCHRLWKLAGPTERLAPQLWDRVEALWALIDRLRALEPSKRAALLDEFRPLIGRPAHPEMLAEPQLRSLGAAGITIGSHGSTHTPIPYAQDAIAELEGSRALLGQRLRSISGGEVQSFSFPHGVYDRPSMAAAEKAGYQLIFTSDKCLNTMPGGRRLPRIFGRINMDAGELSDGSGHLRPELLALWLFRRPHALLE